MTKAHTAGLLVLASLAAIPLSAAQSASSYTGAFSQDSDQRAFFFSLSAAGTVTLRTFSYAGGMNAAGATIPQGGFDPTISVFDSTGNLIAYNRDGGCANVATDSVTGFCWDSWLQIQLPAGNYTAILTESENLPNGPTLADSFVYAGQGNFTAAPGSGAPGFWDFFPNKRTSAYALDIIGATTSQTTTITSSATLPGGIAGNSYQFTFTAVSGPGLTLTWSVAPGSLLPPGLLLNSSTGVLAGQLTSPGNYAFSVQVSDGVQTVTQAVTLNVLSSLTIINTSLPPGQVNQSYGPVAFGEAGGSGAGNWSATGLPTGIGISPFGVISGTPTVGGTFSVQVSVLDPVSGMSAQVTLPLVISYPPLQITSSGALGNFVPGANIAAAPVVIGGAQPYRWSATGLPPGFNFNSATGAFSGVAPSPGVYSFTLMVSDSQSTPAAATLPITFSVLGFTTSSLPNGSTSSAYSQTFNATGGTPPYTFTGTGVPGGLTLASSGLLSGTPAATGTFAFSVQVADSGGLKTSSPFTLVVTGASSPLAVPGGPLSDATVSTLYTNSLSASGGSAPYTWLLVGGALPTGGFSLSSTGGIIGTPKTPGTYTFTAQATDGNGTHVSGTFILNVDAAPLDFASLPSFPDGIVGTEYPLQILTATGGVAPYTFAITGTLPPGLGFSSPQISGIPTAAGTYSFTVTATDSTGKQLVANGSITINPAQAALILSQSAVPFSLTVGSAGVPTPASVPVRSSVVQQILNYSVTASPAAPWLDITGGGTTPGAIGLALDVSALSLAASPAPYQTTVNVTCLAPSPCAGAVQTIAVSLSVTDPAAQLSASSNLISFFSSTSNPVAQSQPFGIQNSGGGTLLINSVTTADTWLSVSGVPASLQSGPATIVTVTANPTGLSAGFYQSSITITSTAGTVVVPVTLNLSANALMTLSSSGAQFEAPAGNAPGISSGSFTISVTGAPSINWSASVQPGANWLSVSTPSGSATPATSGTVNFAIDPAIASGLAPQTYYGLIQVTGGAVTDSPLAFIVVLDIEPASQPPKPQLSTGGITLTSTAGSGKLSAPTVLVYASSNNPLEYQASTSTVNGSNWLSVSPSTGFASSGAPGQSVITVDTTNLTPGTYQGGVNYAFSSDAVRTVNVTLVVVGSSSPLTGSISAAAVPAQVKVGCTPSKLVPAEVGLVDNFAEQAGWPTPLVVNVLDDCGNAKADAQVVVTFSNGDPPLLLSPRDTTSGAFVGTWTPQSISRQITITSQASDTGFKPASIQITGEVTTNSAPILAQNGTVHIFTSQVGTALAPGEIVAIYGTNLAGGIMGSPTVPLSMSLGGTSVIIGGIQVPLYFVSSGQINAQVPFELAPGTYQILANTNGALSTPVSIQLGAVSPEIAVYSTGNIIAQHAADYSLVTEASPAVPGEILIFYLAGMGSTTTPVQSGVASPSSPLANATATPTLTLNGNPVPTIFAGLTPTAVGLYQIDFQVPANTPGGDLPLIVSQAGTATNMTILPVK